MKKIILILLLFFNANLFASTLNGWSNPENCLSINTSSDEFAPFWSKFSNKLYFSCNHKGFAIIKSADKDSLCFINPRIVSGNINSEKENRSYFFQLSENEAYLSAFSMIDGISYSNIFKSEFLRNSWTEPVIIESLKSKSFTAQATVSDNSEILIFSSSRDNENNDADLWMAYRDFDGNWAAPVKIDEINSPGNEITPHLVGSDTLFFASDGLGGPGGFDIFMSERVLGKWSRPRPVNELNTEFNESDFAILSEKEAVFASDRPGGIGGLDLYITRISNNIEKQTEEPETEIEISSQVLTINVVKYQNYIKCDFPNNIDFNNLDTNFKVDKELNENLNSGISSFELYNDSIYVSPTVLAIGHAIRPDDNIREWTCTLFADDNFVDNRKGNEPQSNNLFKLLSHKKSIINADSLVAALEVVTKMHNSFYKRIKIDVNKSTIKMPDYGDSENSKCEKIYFWAEDTEISDELLDYFANSAAYSKAIEIQYFANITHAQTLKNILEKKLRKSIIKLIPTKYLQNSQFSKNISEKILIVNIHKL